MATMKPNTKAVFAYLQEVHGQNVTSADVAEALDLPKRSVDGSFTAGIQKKGYGIRVPAEIELADGTHQQVKFLQLTPEGMALDLDNLPEE